MKSVHCLAQDALQPAAPRSRQLFVVTSKHSTKWDLSVRLTDHITDQDFRRRAGERNPAAASALGGEEPAWTNRCTTFAT
jgi:hypothetical protein